MYRAICFSLAIFLLFGVNNTNLFAKITKLNGQWSLYAGGNYSLNAGISNSMRGTMESVEQDYVNYKDYTQFPFADDKTTSMNLLFNLSYRFPESNIGLFCNINFTNFNVDNDLRTIFGTVLADKWMNLRISSFTPGIDYTFGNEDDLFNAFGRFGIGFNIIGGNVRYSNDYVDINSALRIGFMTEIGTRINIPSTPISYEMSVNYNNINLIGKTRDEEFNYITRIELNDSKSNDNPKIPAKTIDYISVNFGFRLWF